VAACGGAAALVALAVLGGCVTPPRPTEASRRIAANPRASIDGVLRDRGGAPVVGIEVQALPRGKDIPWSPGAVTDANGRFRLSVYAPADYGFVLWRSGIAVVTSDQSDPGRARVAVEPGEAKRGIELTFPRRAWESLAATAVAPQSR
jgi:hypothetical protein